MKKLSALLFLSLIILGTACKKGDESTSAALVGTYKDLGTKGSITVSILGQTSTETVDEPASGGVIEFKADGTISDGSGLNDIKFTKYRTAGNKLVFTATEDGKTFDFAYNYTLSGKTLTLKMDQALFVENINNIAASGADNEFADFKEFASFFTSVDITTTFEKQ